MEPRPAVNRAKRCPTVVNGAILTSRFAVSAGQRLVRTGLGVKGSQVRILSSRQNAGPLT